MNIYHDHITKNIEHSSFRWFLKTVSNHDTSRTIISLYFYLVDSILHKEMAYINMPTILCTGSPPIFCHPYGGLIILENKIILDIISLWLHKHNNTFIQRNILTSSYTFSLSRTFRIQILLAESTMKHFITRWHYYTFLNAHVWMYIILYINLCEQVCDIKNPNDPNIVLCFIQVWYASSKFIPINNIALCKPCGQ